MAIDGYVDELTFGSISGWVFDRASPSTVLNVELLVDGKSVKTMQASIDRPDLRQAGMPACGFDFGDALSQVSVVERAEVRCTAETVPLKNGVLELRPRGDIAYAKAWTKPNTLDELNQEIHDNWPVEKLYQRARFYHHTAFKEIAPDHSVPDNANILEIGSGVGWPMQVALDQFPSARITGLDVSETMIGRAVERLKGTENFAKYKDRFSFKHYDGSKFPFPDNSFDVVYSYATLWHLPDPILVRTLKEAARVLKPGGICICQFIKFENLAYDYSDQIAIQFNSAPGHHRYYHSAEQLLLMAAEIAKMSDVDLLARESIFWLRGSKGGKEAFRRRSIAKAVSDLKSAINGT
jgi:ubiquinone/menaquinone biosynthesis C-methylase UbiE